MAAPEEDAEICVGVAAMSKAFTDPGKWWIYKVEGGNSGWDVNAPGVGWRWGGTKNFPTGAEAIAYFAGGGAR